MEVARGFGAAGIPIKSFITVSEFPEEQNVGGVISNSMMTPYRVIDHNRATRKMLVRPEFAFKIAAPRWSF